MVCDGSESKLADGGGTGLALCGNLNGVRFETKATVGSSCPSVKKELAMISMQEMKLISTG